MTYREAIQKAGREAITNALALSQTRTEAAKKLGIARPKLYSLCQRFGIELEDRRSGNWLGCQ